jgi:hypothetical protein
MVLISSIIFKHFDRSPVGDCRAFDSGRRSADISSIITMDTIKCMQLIPRRRLLAKELESFPEGNEIFIHEYRIT